MKTRNSRLPPQGNAARFRMLSQDAMESGAADSGRCSAREHGLGCLATAYETNTAKGLSFTLGNGDAEFAKSLDPIRHQALAAGFVDGRHGSVGDQNAQPVAARGDGRGQTRRAAAGYEYIHRVGRSCEH